MQNIINGKLSIITGIRQLATFLSPHSTGHGALRGFAGAINARICVTIAALAGLVALFVPWGDPGRPRHSPVGRRPDDLCAPGQRPMGDVADIAGAHRSDADGPLRHHGYGMLDRVHRPAAELSYGCAAVHPGRHPSAAEIHAVDPR